MVPWGTREPVPRDKTLLEIGPLALPPNGEVPSPVVEGRTPCIYAWGVSEELLGYSKWQAFPKMLLIVRVLPIKMQAMILIRQINGRP